MPKSPEGRPQGHKPKQRGVYLSPDGNQFHRGAQLGDKEIQPKKLPKKRCKGPTSFEEVVAYQEAVRKIQDGETVTSLESLDGGTIMIDPNTGIKSVVGEVDTQDDRPFTIAEKRNIPIPTLSPVARRLFYALRNKEQKK